MRIKVRRVNFNMDTSNSSCGYFHSLLSRMCFQQSIKGTLGFKGNQKKKNPPESYQCFIAARTSNMAHYQEASKQSKKGIALWTDGYVKNHQPT